MRTIVAWIVFLVVVLLGALFAFNGILVHSVQSIINNMQHIGGHTLATQKFGKSRLIVTEYQPISASTISWGIVGIVGSFCIYFLSIIIALRVFNWIENSTSYRPYSGRKLTAKQTDAEYKEMMHLPPTDIV